MRFKTSRLLITFFVMAAFLFGQATALEHAAQYGGQVHTLADHASGDEGGDDSDSDVDGDGLCDLSLFGAGHDLALSAAPNLCLTNLAFQFDYAPRATAFLRGVHTTGPPVRGPPSLS